MPQSYLDKIADIRKRYQLTVLVETIILIALIIGLVSIFNPILVPLVMLSFVSLTITLSLYKRKMSKYKPLLVNELTKKYFDKASYYHDIGLSIDDVMASDLLKRPDRFFSEDYIEGSLEGVNFVSSDIHMQEERVVYHDDKTTYEYITYFLGRFFIFDFNKKLNGRVLVTESKKSTIFTKYKKITLESIEFNKVFNTYSINEHEAFYILTPHFMEALLELERRNPGRIYVSFIEDKMYLGIHNNKDTFEIKLFGKGTARLIEEFEEDLKVIRDIILSLKLDNKIYK